MARAILGPGKKRVSITVDAESWNKAQSLAKEAGLSRNWLSAQISATLPHIVAVVETYRAKKKATAQDALHELVERLVSDPHVLD